MPENTTELVQTGNRHSPYNEVNVGPLLIAFGLGLFLVLAFTWDTVPAMVALVVAAGALLGYAIGRYPLHLSDVWVLRECNLTAEDLRKLDGNFERQEGRFLTFSSALVAAYVVFYWFAAWRMSDPAGGETVSWMVVALAVLTIGSFCYAAARYAAYVRIANLLGSAIKHPPAEERVVRCLHGAVFRGEQLYEPAGNLFVTLGITATFLGLAVGLVTLDFAQFFPEPGETPAAAANRGPNTVASLGSFIGCMGLALGMSMLGVLTAMAAQWLRGYGPPEATDELLRRARLQMGAADPAKPAATGASAPNQAGTTASVSGQ